MRARNSFGCRYCKAETAACQFLAPYVRQRTEHSRAKEDIIIVVLVILWLLGLVTSYTMGGRIHVLLVIAIVVVLLRVIGGHNPL